MFIIGVVFLAISVFLGAFVFAFNMILNPADDSSSKEQALIEENKRLRQEVQLLEDQLSVATSKLEDYQDDAEREAEERAAATPKPTTKPSSTATPKPTTKPAATPKPTAKPTPKPTVAPTQKPTATSESTGLID